MKNSPKTKRGPHKTIHHVKEEEFGRSSSTHGGGGGVEWEKKTNPL